MRSDMVTVFVARRAGAGFELLQLRRAADDYLGGTWQTVRGTIEAGETASGAAIRELREEAGLTPIEFYRLGLIESFYIDVDDTMCHSAAFAAIVADDAAVTLNEEHDAFRWIDRFEAQWQFMWPSERPLLQTMDEIIFQNGQAKQHLLIPLPRTD